MKSLITDGKRHFKKIIFTTNKSLFTQKRLDTIYRTLRSAENCIVDDFVIEEIDITKLDFSVSPMFIDSSGRHRLSREWFRRNFTEKGLDRGFETITFHAQRSDRAKLNMSESTINGSYWNSSQDEYGELYYFADNNTRRPTFATDMDFLTRLDLHETGHRFTHSAGRVWLRDELNIPTESPNRELPVHYFDYDLKDLPALFPNISFSRWNNTVFAISLLEQLRDLLTLKAIRESQPRVRSREEMLHKWAMAIKDYEGYFTPEQRPPHGSISYRQNNIGNLRFSPFEVDNRNGFSVFSTYEQGVEALKHQITIAVDGRSRVYRPDMTLLRFFEVYAPTDDNNNPRSYAQYVASRLGVSINTPINQII